jgi:hypothetical protein
LVVRGAAHGTQANLAAFLNALQGLGWTAGRNACASRALGVLMNCAMRQSKKVV